MSTQAQEASNRTMLVGSHTILPLVSVQQASGQQLPPGVSEIPGDTPVRSIAASSTPASSLSMGSDGLVVNTDGSFSCSTDPVEIPLLRLGTTLPVAMAEALCILARMHKQCLMGFMGMREHAAAAAPLLAMIKFWQQTKSCTPLPEQGHKQGGALQQQEEDKEEEEAHDAGPGSRQQPAAGSSPDLAVLNPMSFDGIVDAFFTFVENRTILARLGRNPDTIIDPVRTLLQEVVVSEAEEAGVHVHDAEALLREWRAAARLRNLCNTTAAHPLHNTGLAGKVCQLLACAVAVHHPLLAEIPTVSQEAFKAAEQHADQLQEHAGRNIEACMLNALKGL